MLLHDTKIETVTKWLGLGYENCAKGWKLRTHIYTGVKIKERERKWYRGNPWFICKSSIQKCPIQDVMPSTSILKHGKDCFPYENSLVIICLLYTILLYHQASALRARLD